MEVGLCHRASNPPVCLLLSVPVPQPSLRAAAQHTGPLGTAENELRQGSTAAASGPVTCCQDEQHSAHGHLPELNAVADEFA